MFPNSLARALGSSLSHLFLLSASKHGFRHESRPRYAQIAPRSVHPGAAKEVRGWIEDTLGERLPPGDLMDALKDGVALCKYASSRIRAIHHGPPLLTSSD